MEKALSMVPINLATVNGEPKILSAKQKDSKQGTPSYVLPLYPCPNPTRLPVLLSFVAYYILTKHFGIRTCPMFVWCKVPCTPMGE